MYPLNAITPLPEKSPGCPRTSHVAVTSIAPPFSPICETHVTWPIELSTPVTSTSVTHPPDRLTTGGTVPACALLTVSHGVAVDPEPSLATCTLSLHSTTPFRVITTRTT